MRTFALRICFDKRSTVHVLILNMSKSKSKECYLVCVKHSHPPISLPNMKEIFLGRCPDTQIIEKRCSKNQLSFYADMSHGVVRVRQIGPNLSSMNEVPLGKRVTREAHHGDTVDFLLGAFTHRIEFDPPPKYSSDLDTMPPTGQKRLSAADESPDFKKICNGNGFTVDGPCIEDRWEKLFGGKVLLFTSRGVKDSSKVAAYDLDGTIIVTKTGRVFAKDAHDWKILWPEIPVKLKALHKDGFKIVILTNQAGISRGKLSIPDFKKKVENIVAELGVPIQLFAATGESVYRKPAPGMWDLLVSDRNGGKEIDFNATFYCGDAAGRPDNWAPKVKKDFSCSDRMMACNLDLRFFTPEEHFKGLPAAPFIMPEFNPRVIPDGEMPLVEPPGASLIGKEQEVLVLVGSPGSGKSFICKNHLGGYIHVNRDSLGTWQKCVAAVKTALADGLNVVVDNTNPDPESRSRYIEVARNAGVSCRCAVMDSSTARSRHNNKYRDYIGEDHESISEMVMNSYKSKFKYPEQSEGFKEIIRVNFKPVFANADHERLYKMYLLDRY